MSDNNPQSNSAFWTTSFRGPNRPLFTKGGPPGYIENGLAAVAQPFKGITTDGTIVPGLFPIRKTSVATHSVREAAEDFIGSLNSDQRTKTLFPIYTVEWRKLRQHYEQSHHSKPS